MAARHTLVHAPGPVTLVGAGPVPPEALAAARALAPTVVAADGGADAAVAAGVRLTAAIGDLDSLADPAALRATGVAVHEIAEQDTTDLEKCLYSVEAPAIVGVGFLGGRVDHELAALHALACHPDRCVVLVGAEDVCFLCPPLLRLDLAEGTRVSLFPLAPATGTVSEGLVWPVDGLALAPTGRIGTSNRATGEPVRVGFDAPGVIAILPADRLHAVLAALASTALWPPTA